MSQAQWTAVDHYLQETLLPPDPVLDAALQAADAAGLPAIQVSALHGQLLQILAQAMGARRILEIGTLGGYSTIWLARALPADGQLVTLELLPEHATVAQANFVRAGLSGQIELRVGSALQSLAALGAEGVEPFDLVFIDADKRNYPNYYRLVRERMQPGGWILADNVLWSGKIVQPQEKMDADTRALAAFNDAVHADPQADHFLAPIRDGILIIRMRN